MPAYELYCTMCKKSFHGRGNWLKHLIEDDHQKIATVEVSEWDEKMKKCAIVAFASCPMATCALELIEFLSKGMDIVTDFVFIPQLLHVGILQFEIKHKVNEVMTTLKDKGSQVEINSEQFQFRKAISYMDLEWKQLVPKVIPKIQKRKCGSQPNLPESAEVLKRQKMQNICEMEPLQTQFKRLLENVKIPDANIATAHNLVSKLRKMFRVRYPFCDLYLFRNWNLQLKNANSDALLIGIDVNGKLSMKESECENLPCQLQDVETILETGNAEKVLEIMKISYQSHFNIKSTKHIVYYVHKPTNLKFALVFNPWLMKEIQTCRLLEYLCAFDNRVKPLHTMISFWSTSNKVRLSNGISRAVNAQLKCTPEPAALEWLVMLFLAHRKIIPTPREIQQNSNKNKEKQRVGRGITFDPDFCTTWRSSKASSVADEDTDEFITEVLALAADFFDFIGRLKTSSWILNLKDGEIISMRDFVKKKPFTQWQTKFTLEEIENLRKEKSLMREPKRKTIIFVHPLYKQSLTFSSGRFYHKACPLFKRTAKRIELFLNNKASNDADLMSLFQHC